MCLPKLSKFHVFFCFCVNPLNSRHSTDTINYKSSTNFLHCLYTRLTIVSLWISSLKTNIRFCTGDYEVSVKFNDEHIPNSPFPVHVSGVGSAPTDSVRLILHVGDMFLFGSLR